MDIYYQFHNDIRTELKLFITHEELKQIKDARVHFNPPAWINNPICDLLDNIINEIDRNNKDEA